MLIDTTVLTKEKKIQVEIKSAAPSPYGTA